MTGRHVDLVPERRWVKVEPNILFIVALLSSTCRSRWDARPSWRQCFERAIVVRVCVLRRTLASTRWSTVLGILEKSSSLKECYNYSKHIGATQNSLMAEGTSFHCRPYCVVGMPSLLTNIVVWSRSSPSCPAVKRMMVGSNDFPVDISSLLSPFSI